VYPPSAMITTVRHIQEPSEARRGYVSDDGTSPRPDGPDEANVLAAVDGPMNPTQSTQLGAWQEGWDRQQESYLPDREHRFTAMLDAVEALTYEDSSPRVLDLAGGTGSISLRVISRWPEADIVLVDIDPVLLAIARGTFRDRIRIVATDLRNSDWPADLEPASFDAVLTATALHWLPLERQMALYAEAHSLLRPGGILINADHMPDDGLPSLTSRLATRAASVRDARYAAGAAMSWQQWWQRVSRDPVLGPLAQRRRQLFGDAPAEFIQPVSWHMSVLADAGFAEIGLVWRGGQDAAVAAIRSRF
jgi:SAM-dependent methyltransferase